jgi:signal transduction histidine kinase
VYTSISDFLSDIKDYFSRKRYHSLYLELALSALLGAIIAVSIYIAAQTGASLFINTQLTSDIKKQERENEYVAALEEYVKDNNLSVKRAGRLIDIESSPYVRIAVYSDIPDEDDAEEDKVATRDEMAAYASAHGLYLIDLVDGTVMVSINDFAEFYYYNVSASINFVLALLVFVFVMLLRIRKIINRIKRLQSDVAVVSYSDMNHEITVDGNNDVAKLAANVETMRLAILDNLRKEKEARDANTELITSLSHDVRTPLTVILGYLEMMKKKSVDDEMREYISITEQTAMRLKMLSDDMFKYFLIYGNTEEKIKLEEYNANTLLSQMLTEHFVLLYENGYEISLDKGSLDNDDKINVITDADNLMRIFDNIFSNIHKYADKSEPIRIKASVLADLLTIEISNKIAKDISGTESNKIGLKTCSRLAEFILERFEYSEHDGVFTTRIVIKLAIAESMPEIKPVTFSSSI